jgi:hypothetical protein
MNALDSKGSPIFPGDYVIAYGNLFKVVHANTGHSNARVWLEADNIQIPDTQAMSGRILKISTEDVLIMKLKETI